MYKEPDPWLSDDKFAHFVLHWAIVTIFGIFGNAEMGLAFSLLWNVAWEVKDSTSVRLVIRWDWVQKLTGGPYDLSGYRHFSLPDFIWGLAGAVAAGLLGRFGF